MGKRIAVGDVRLFRGDGSEWDCLAVDPYAYSVVDGQIVCPASYGYGHRYGENYGVSPDVPVLLVWQQDPSVVVDLSALQRVNVRRARAEHPDLSDEELFWKIGVFRKSSTASEGPLTTEYRQLSAESNSPPVERTATSPESRVVETVYEAAEEGEMRMTTPVETQREALDLAAVDMPWLTVRPEPPRRKVIFDLGRLGLLTVLFHHVVYREGGSLLSLIRDVRYPSLGYVPPRTDEPIQVTIYSPDSPSVQIGSATAEEDELSSRLFLCRADPRLNMHLGCLEIINLIVTGP